MSRRSGRYVSAAAATSLALLTATPATLATAANTPTGNTGGVTAAAVTPTQTDPGDPADRATLFAQARTTGNPVTIPSLTSETQLVTANPDGTYTMTSTSQPTRVRRGTDWVPIDTTLTRTADGTIRATATSNELTLSSGGSAPLLTLASTTRSLSVTYPTALPTPVLAGDTATYPEIYPGVDLAVTALPAGYSHALVIKNAAAAANPALRAIPLTYTVTGLDLTLDTTGAMTATDENGRAVYNANPPQMWDSNTNPQVGGRPTARDSGGAKPRQIPHTGNPAFAAPTPASRTATTTSTTITLTPPPDALTGNITYPVYIDPSFTSGIIATKTLRLTDSAQQWNLLNPSDYMRVGRCQWAECDTAYKARSFFLFDTSLIAGQPTTATILDTRFETRQFWNAAGCTKTTVNLWRSGVVDASTVWGGPLITTVGSASTNYSTSCATAPPTVVKFTDTRLTSYLQEVANVDAPSAGLALVAPDETDRNQWKKFDINPALIITFAFPPTYSPITSAGFVTCDGTWYTPSATPTITAGPIQTYGALDPGATVDFWWENNNHSYTPNNTSPTIFSTGQYAAFTMPPLGDGLHVTLTVTHVPGTTVTSVASPPQYFTVATQAPAKPTITSTTYPRGFWGLGTPTTQGVITAHSPNATAYSYAFDATPPTPTTTTCDYTAPGYTNTGQITVPVLPVGPHTLTVRAFNAAHVMSAPVDYEFYIAPYAPTLTSGNALTFTPAPATLGTVTTNGTSTTLTTIATTGNPQPPVGSPRTFTTTIPATTQPTFLEADYTITLTLAVSASTPSAQFAIDGKTILANPTGPTSDPLTYPGTTTTPTTINLGTTHLTKTPHTLTVTLTNSGALRIDQLTLQPVNNVTYGSLRESYNNNGLIGDLTGDSGANLELHSEYLGLIRTDMDRIATLNGFGLIPAANSQRYDNTIATGQTITLSPTPGATRLKILASVTCPTSNTACSLAEDPRIQFTLNFTDPTVATINTPVRLPGYPISNGSSTIMALTPDQNTPRSIIAGPNGITTSGTSNKRIYVITINLPTGQALASLTLPNIATDLSGNALTTTGQTALHIFAIATTDDTGAVPNPGRLNGNTTLQPGDALFSPDVRYMLVMQTDGNLVLYDTAIGNSLWHTSTYGHPGATATMQTDGNFVVYHNGTPLWHAGTYNNPGAYLALQNDHNLVIYTTQGTPIWWYALSPPP